MNIPTWTQEPWDALLRYSSALQKVVRSWGDFMEHDFVPDYFTDEDVRSWLTRFEHSMIALRDLYVYDTMRKLRIHPVASGFPERLHIRILDGIESDDLVSDHTLRRAWLDHLFEDQVVNLGLLERVAKNNARERIERHPTMKLFAVTRLQKITGRNGKAAYVCCFERYCRLHRPSLYVLVFESDEETLDAKCLTDLTEVLREESSSLPRLITMARHIDHAFATIHPVWLGRISLGPIFVSHVTQDDHALQKTLDELTPEGEFSAASRIIYEHIAAEKAEPVNKLYDPQGRKHEYLQQFAVRELDEDCSERGVTAVTKHLFAPHHIIQALPEEFRRSIGHKVTIVEK